MSRRTQRQVVQFILAFFQFKSKLPYLGNFLAPLRLRFVTLGLLLFLQVPVTLLLPLPLHFGAIAGLSPGSSLLLSLLLGITLGALIWAARKSAGRLDQDFLRAVRLDLARRLYANSQGGFFHSRPEVASAEGLLEKVEVLSVATRRGWATATRDAWLIMPPLAASFFLDWKTALGLLLFPLALLFAPASWRNARFLNYSIVGTATLLGYIPLENVFIFSVYAEASAGALFRTREFLRLYPACSQGIAAIQEAARNLPLSQLPEFSAPGNSPTVSLKHLSLESASGRGITRGFSFTFPNRALVALAAADAELAEGFCSLLSGHAAAAEGLLIAGQPAEKFPRHELSRVLRNVPAAGPAWPLSFREFMNLENAEPLADSEITALLRKAGIHAESLDIPLCQHETGARAHVAQGLAAKHAVRNFQSPTRGLSPEAALELVRGLRPAPGRNQLSFFTVTHPAEAAEADYVLFFGSGVNPTMAPHAELLRYNPRYREFVAAGSP